MSIFKKKFGILKDVRKVADPFGAGVIFHIRRKGHPAYKAHAAEMAQNNELAIAFQSELGRQQVKAQMTGRKLDKEAAIDRAFEKVGYQLTDGGKFVAANRLRVAHLIDGWEGEEAPFSLEAAVEMLSLENPIAETEPFATLAIDLDDDELAAEKAAAEKEGREPKTQRTVHRNLGEALMAFIEASADEEAAYLEGLAKNSPASSVAEPASSAD